jgi:predicted nucleotidyltransferase
MTEKGGVIFDTLGWEIGHLINQLIKGNVNAIWNTVSPLVLQPSPIQVELKKLVQANLCRVTYQSIKGMAESQMNYEQRPERIAGKGYMTALRTLNFGIKLLNEGKLCFVPVRHIPEAKEVMEKMCLLVEAYESSPLPDRPDEEAFREFLLRLRLEEMAEG